MELALGFLFLLNAAQLAWGVWERKQHSDERRELCQRIQAPEQAVAAYKQGRDGAAAVAPIALDDDQAYEKLRLEREGLVAD